MGLEIGYLLLIHERHRFPFLLLLFCLSFVPMCNIELLNYLWTANSQLQDTCYRLHCASLLSSQVEALPLNVTGLGNSALREEIQVKWNPQSDRTAFLVRPDHLEKGFIASLPLRRKGRVSRGRGDSAQHLVPLQGSATPPPWSQLPDFRIMTK